MLTVSQQEGICTVSLNRPECRNAFNAALIQDLIKTFEQISAASDIRAVHLRGEGKVFSAGADLEWMRAMAAASEAENVRDAGTLGRLFHVIDVCPKPVVCEVHGAAMGGGVGLVAASDIVVAKEGTQFALSEVRLGLIPAVISPYVIRKIGVSQARRYFLTAETFDACEARRIGLVHEVTADDVSARVADVLKMLRGNGPEAVAGAKALIRDVGGEPSSALQEQTYRAIARHRVSAEGQEGMSAFLEKRAPKWQE